MKQDRKKNKQTMQGKGRKGSMTKKFVELLGEITHRHVLLLDTYEVWSGWDNWLRDEFLPKLSESGIVVMAGREPLSAGWQADPGWQMLVRQIPLRNLSPEEGREFLERR